MHVERGTVAGDLPERLLVEHVGRTQGGELLRVRPRLLAGPAGGDVRVRGIHAREARTAAARREALQLDVDVAVEQAVAALLGLVERAVPEQDVDRAVTTASGPPVDERAGAVALDRQRQQVVAELLGEGERPPARLAEIADRHEPEAAVQQRRWAAQLL